MLHWYEHLSISQACLLGFGLIMLAGWAWVLIAACLRDNRSIPPRRRHTDSAWSDYTAKRKKTPPATPWPIVDYSGQYADKEKWLGPEGLMARPAKRVTERGENVV